MSCSRTMEQQAEEALAQTEGSPSVYPMASALVARQPILDGGLNVVAYELLYRRTEGEDRAIVRDAVQATADVIAGATLDIGFRRLVGDVPAYMNFPPTMLASRPKLPLDPARMVIEVIEGAAPEPQLLDGLMWLRSDGYRIALDDFDVRTESLELLDYADIVKVDVQQHSPEALAESVRTLRQSPLQLIAEKIETAEELALCRELGFDLFQGYFLQRPETFSARRVPTSRLAALELFLSLDEQRVSAEHVESCIARDVGLSYRLLRCINSSYYRTPREVGSIRQAIVLLGYEELRRICAVILLTSLADRPAYVALHALTRARMCQSLSQMAGLPCADACFMTGLLSMADVILGLPIEECLQQLPLNDVLRVALLHRRGPPGEALQCVLSYERGQWEQVKYECLPQTQIASAYAMAIEWAEGLRVALRGP